MRHDTDCAKMFHQLNRAMKYQDDTLHSAYLGCELGGLLRRVVLGVGRNEAALQLLHADVLDVEADVVARARLRQRLVVHLH